MVVRYLIRRCALRVRKVMADADTNAEVGWWKQVVIEQSATIVFLYQFFNPVIGVYHAPENFSHTKAITWNAQVYKLFSTPPSPVLLKIAVKKTRLRRHAPPPHPVKNWP